jgi:predicted lactoylglutathione lyase
VHVAEPSCCEVLLALEKVESPDIDQIPAELIQAGGKTLQSEIHKLSMYLKKRKNCHSSGRNLFLYVFMRRTIKL